MFAVDLGGGALLRPIEPWQAEEFLAHIDRARAVVDPWIPWASRSTDLESARATLQRYADLQARDAGRLYGIWLDGTLVGGTMFVHFDAKAGACEIGCWLEPAGQGRGLITKAAGHLVDWAIGVRGIHRVVWQNRPENIASRNVAQRLGMRLEGVLREEFLYQGERHDTEVWSLLAPEWQGLTAGHATAPISPRRGTE
ncbi:GNAT family N-acetyltransferase [Phytohabitans kaempferiae]|uniref:GNAT family N-acetyltransferase n=1 Tax=Phytohabitans kaempferiae TaxID=1620943 RepID=A0ABV6M4M7_9ACTN